MRESTEQKKTRAFTLIELLMVFFVMTLLGGILSVIAVSGLQAFSRAREQIEFIEQATVAFDLIRRDLLSAVYKDPETGSAMPSVSFIGTSANDTAGRAQDTLNFFSQYNPPAVGRTDVTSVNYRRGNFLGSGTTTTMGNVGDAGYSTTPRLFLRGSRDTSNGAASNPPPAALDGTQAFEPLFTGDVMAFDAQYLLNATGAYQATWDTGTAAALPRAVRVQLTLRNARGKEKTFTQTVTLNLQ